MPAPNQDKQFAWDAIPEAPERAPFVLLAEGLQGSGKTHLGYTFPKPIFHLDTENRGDKVAAKFVASGAQAYRKVCSDFSDIRRTLTELVFPNHQSGTVLIDSGSELLMYAEAEWLVEAKKEKVFPLVLWAKVNAKVDKMIASVRDRGFYIVITARLKPEYKGDEKTGEFVMEGYKRLPYLADVHLRISGGQAQVLKNGFRNTAAERAEPLVAPSFQTIIDELIAARDTAAATWTEPSPPAPAPTPADSARNTPPAAPPSNGHADGPTFEDLGQPDDTPERVRAKGDLETWLSDHKSNMAKFRSIFQKHFRVDYEAATADQYRQALPWIERIYASSTEAGAVQP